MKKIPRVPTFILLIISIILLSIMSIVGGKSIYAMEEQDILRKPILSKVFTGIHNEYYPWDIFNKDKRDFAKENAKAQKEYEEYLKGKEAKAGTDAVAADESGSDIKNAGKVFDLDSLLLKAYEKDRDKSVGKEHFLDSLIIPFDDFVNGVESRLDNKEGFEVFIEGIDKSISGSFEEASSGSLEAPDPNSVEESSEASKVEQLESSLEESSEASKVEQLESSLEESSANSLVEPSANSLEEPSGDSLEGPSSIPMEEPSLSPSLSPSPSYEPRYEALRETTLDEYKKHISADIYGEAGVDFALSYDGYEQVDISYFDDALFIGDSRTAGLRYYTDISKHADFLAETSSTIWKTLKSDYGGAGTVDSRLKKKQYAKIYLMVGVNEIGTGTTEKFFEQYTYVVDHIRELQPDAIIYIQAIMNIDKAKSESDNIYNNQNILSRNHAIATLADNKSIFYLDINEAVCDEEGYLREDLRGDHFHLKSSSNEYWKDYLLSHAVMTDEMKAKEAERKAEEAKKIEDEAKKKAEEELKQTEEESKQAEEESKKVEEESKKVEEESKKVEEESKKVEEESKQAEEESKKVEEESKQAEE